MSDPVREETGADDVIPPEVTMLVCPECGWAIHDDNGIEGQPCEAYLEGADEAGSCGPVVTVVYTRAAAALPSGDGLSDDERARLDQLEQERAEGLEIQGDYLDEIAKLGYEVVQEADGPCFWCSLSRMFDSLLAASSSTEDGDRELRA